MKKILLVLLLIITSQTLKAQNVMSNQSVFDNFVMQINEHNPEGLFLLMSDNPTFTDAHGNVYEGKDKIKAGWESYFKMFPDYKIAIESSAENANYILAMGTAEGTYGVSDGTGANHWKIPASWKAVIENGKVLSWQVFADTKIPNDIIELYKKGNKMNIEEKVTGIGGVFLKSKDPKALGEWYNKHLGTKINEYSYMSFDWSERGNANSKASTTFGLFSYKSKYFDPSTSQFMINFRVKDLHKLLAQLRADGVTVMEKIEEADYGKFGWIMDIDGNKIELWEPVDEVLDAYEKSK